MSETPLTKKKPKANDPKKEIIGEIVNIPQEPISSSDISKFFTIGLSISGGMAADFKAIFNKGTANFEGNTSSPAGTTIKVHYNNLPAGAAANGEWDLHLQKGDLKIASRPDQKVVVKNS